MSWTIKFSNNKPSNPISLSLNFGRGSISDKRLDPADNQYYGIMFPVNPSFGCIMTIDSVSDTTPESITTRIKAKKSTNVSGFININLEITTRAGEDIERAYFTFSSDEYDFSPV